MFVYFRRAGAGWKELNDSFSSSNPGSSPTQFRFSMFSRARAAGKYLLSGDPWWSKILVSGKVWTAENFKLHSSIFLSCNNVE